MIDSTNIMKKVLMVLWFASAFEVSAQTDSHINAPHARETAFQLSLTPDIALYPRTATVRGVALNIWGENPQHGFTLGFVNGSTGDSAGFSWGLVNYDQSYHGVQWGLINVSHEEFIGWQRGLINVDQGTFVGYQDGLVNVTEDARGFQLGIVNYAQNLDGLQIGLINVAMNNPWFTEFPDKLATGFPIVNWSF
jgi:hypothetical protein